MKALSFSLSDTTPGAPDRFGARVGRAVRLSVMMFGVSAALSACALVHSYQKCGFEGCTGDAEVTAQVQAAFRQHPALEEPNGVDVQTVDNVVYLYGLVNTEVNRADAQEVAKSVPGVTRVVNSIAVAGN
jgi:osmotically-inducible protein OsmY